MLVPGVEVNREPLANGDEHVIVRHPTELSYTVLSGEEADVLPLIDGRTPLAELPLEAAELVGLLDAHHLLADRPPIDVWASVQRGIERPDRLRSRLRRAATNLEAEWKNAEPTIRSIYRFFLRPFFTVPGAVFGIALTLAGAVFFGLLVAQRPFPETQSAGWGLALLIGLELVIISIHELGHAAVLVHHRRRVHGAGFRIYFGAPAFYIESSDALMLPRHLRILQSAAGPWFEAMAVGVLAIVLFAAPTMPASDVIWRFLALNYFGLFLNLIPLLELDGYWILSDWMRVPDLRPRSLAFVRGEMWRKLWHRQRWTRSEVGFALYGTIGVAFTIACLGSSAFFWERTFGGLVRSLWNGGWTGRLGLLVLAVLVGGPLIRAGGRLVGGVRRWMRSVLRRARFRAQRGWRIEAAHLLDAVALFEDLPVDVLNDVSGRMQLRHYARGATVLRQGDRAEAFHVIREGAAEVVEVDPAGAERVIRALGPGETFGEAGLFDGSPRTATVRASARLETIAIDRATFERLLAARVASRPAYAPSFGDVERLRAIGAFGHLSTAELLELAGAAVWRAVEAGETIVAQGDVAGSFFSIESGHVTVTEAGVVKRQLGAGDHFGEIALLGDGVRTATVRASTHVRLVELGADVFRSFVDAAFRAGRLRPHVDPTRQRSG